MEWKCFEMIARPIWVSRKKMSYLLLGPLIVLVYFESNSSSLSDFCAGGI